MNGYSAANAWAKFVRANGRKVKSVHVALMSACFQIANEEKWVSEFPLPTKDAMELSCIRDKETFYKTLKDIVSFGAITILEESRNIYTARWVTFENLPFYLSEIPTATPTAIPTTTPSGKPTTNRPNNKDNKIDKQLNFKTNNDADRVEGEEVTRDDTLEEEEKKKSPPKVPPKGSPPGFEFGLEMPFDTAEFAEAWESWAIYKKEIRKKLTESTAKVQLKKLSQYPEQIAIAMINQSIEQAWTGLFELKQVRPPTIHPANVPEKGKIQTQLENTDQAIQNIMRRRELQEQE